MPRGRPTIVHTPEDIKMKNALAERLRKCRTGKRWSHDTLLSELAAFGFTTSKQHLIDLEKKYVTGEGTNGVITSYEEKGNAAGIRLAASELRIYAKFYGVTCDYLLGITEVKSPDIDTRAICDRTGLSDEAVNALHRWKNRETYQNGINHTNAMEADRYLILLSFLIENEEHGAHYSGILENLYLRIFAKIYAPLYRFTEEKETELANKLRVVEEKYKGTIFEHSGKQWYTEPHEYERIRANAIEKVMGRATAVFDFVPLQISGNGLIDTDALGQDDIAKIYDGKIIEILSALREYANEHKEAQDG